MRVRFNMADDLEEDAPKERWDGFNIDWSRCDPEDVKLVLGVLLAAAKGLPPDQIEAVVGRKADFDQPGWPVATFHMPSPPGEETLTLDTRPGQATEADLALSTRVLYWRRPGESFLPEIIGLAWAKDGRPKPFFGTFGRLSQMSRYP
jgi:hypothetical protein